METKDLISIINKTHKWINILETNNLSGFPNGWTSLREVQLAHIVLMDEIVNQEYIPPTYKYERGIVIGAGGAKYFGCAFACVYVLRQLGCKLPVEFWYLDEYEMDNNMKKLCSEYDIHYINATEYAKNNELNPRILNGWELKPFSTLHSSFKEVLYLDADNVPSQDPTYLFDLPEYKKLGAIFWPDLPPNSRKEWLPPICWNNVGLEYKNEPDFETGQYLIDKSKCYKELFLTNWMNQHSDWFYKFVYGDKSTFHLAWRKCESDYAMPSRPAGWRRPSILQYDLNGTLVFQHSCQGKEMIFAGRLPMHHKNASLIPEALQKRLEHWSGTIYSWDEMNENEKDLAQKYCGEYKYERINLGSRVLELLPGGDIGVGKAKCERRWSVRIINNIPTIVVIGSAHKDSEIAMFFAQDDGSSKKFNGKWTAFEKCDIIMERL